MPKKNISEDSYSIWNINGDDLTWTLHEDAKITVNGEPAVNVLAASTGNTVKLLGDIEATDDFGEGADISGADTKVIVGTKSVIEAAHGIDGNAGGFRLVNKGEIDAVDYGVTSFDSANIRNRGEIGANIGIAASSGGKVVNGKDGHIHGDTTGVNMGGSNATLINDGTISGDIYAVSIHSFGDNTFINTGEIQGNILLGNGDDLLDSRKGTIVGDIIGGDGDDVYKLGKNQVDIEEDAGEGTDAVYSGASHWLDSHMEHLFLTGKKDASGGGNDEDNLVFGNKGENTLLGGEGDDYVGGGRGNDVLSGDGGEDWFTFSKDDGKDEVVDFTKGEDVIWLTGFDMNFAEVQSRMSQHGNDTWIQMGDGDRLVIDNVDMDELEASDFSFHEFVT